MPCCCPAIEAEFDARTMTKKLEQYRQRGPAQTTQLLVDALVAAGVEGRTLLDIGGGVGAIQHALLRAGAQHATSVEVAAAALDVARAEAQRQGHADRLSAQHGDFVALADAIPPADIVTLDRVICCYPAMEALVSQSAARARALYGLVYPRDTWWMKLGLALINGLCWARRSPFRVFAHPTATVDALVQRNGLTRRFYHATFVWQVVMYGR